MKISIVNNYEYVIADLQYDAFTEKFIADFIVAAAR